MKENLVFTLVFLSSILFTGNLFAAKKNLGLKCTKNSQCKSGIRSSDVTGAADGPDRTGQIEA